MGPLYYDIVLGLTESNDEETVCDAIAQNKIQMTRKAVLELDLASSIQQFYLRLLYRYLNFKHGNSQGQLLMLQYNEALNKVREMRKIQLVESLQL